MGGIERGVSIAAFGIFSKKINKTFNCGQVVVLDDDTDTMPPCPKCNGTKFH